MQKTDATVSKGVPTVSKYSAISTDVWEVFKKYHPEGANLSTITQDIHELDEKYKDTDGYKLMQELLKAYFNELNRGKG